MDLLLTSLTVLAVVTGIQAVGVVLMAAMLITPAAAARFWTNDVRIMTVLAAIMGGVSGLSGAYVSYVAPAMPTGPWIVMIISAIALTSFFIAPKRGIISRGIQQRRLQRMIMDENLLKELYHLGEKDADIYKARSIEEIVEERFFPKDRLRSSLRRLRREGFITKENGPLAIHRSRPTKRTAGGQTTQALGVISFQIHEN